MRGAHPGQRAHRVTNESTVIWVQDFRENPAYRSRSAIGSHNARTHAAPSPRESNPDGGPQLQRREMEREQAAYAAAGAARTAAMTTDEDATAGEEKEKKRLVVLRRPRTTMHIERPRELKAAETNESRWRTATEREIREAKKDDICADKR